ncbi:MAG: N-carbamoylsarcosine amidase [Rhodobacteraceae bacterium]|nr:N-carbamoylsarcosine amidase [Paracoccaceae bacterium]
MTENDIYQKQSFGAGLEKGTKPALIVVDFVNGFIDPEVFGGGNCLEAAEASVPVVAAFRQAGLPVVFTRVIYAEDGSDAGVWCEKVPRLKELTETNPMSQVVDFLAPEPGDVIIRKRQASAFFDTPLSAILRSKGVDSVVIVGATTSGCVRATVVDAMSHDFRPTVIADCVGDRALGPHEANLFDMKQKYANIIVAKDVGQILP